MELSDKSSYLYEDDDFEMLIIRNSDTYEYYLKPKGYGNFHYIYGVSTKSTTWYDFKKDIMNNLNEDKNFVWDVVVLEEYFWNKHFEEKLTKEEKDNESQRTN